MWSRVPSIKLEQIKCCRGCTDRRVYTENGKVRTCHGTCERYAAAKAKRDQQWQEQYKAYKTERDAERYERENKKHRR